MSYLFVGLGGIFGALARFKLGQIFSGKGGTFPLGILVINTTGSFLLGFVAFYLTGLGLANSNLYFALTTGFLGAYTTFSTFTVEALQLMEKRNYLAATAYVGGNFFLGFTGVILGKQLAMALLLF